MDQLYYLLKQRAIGDVIVFHTDKVEGDSVPPERLFLQQVNKIFHFLSTAIDLY